MPIGVKHPRRTTQRPRDQNRRPTPDAYSTPDGVPVHSFRTLLEDLATIARNRVQPKLPGAPPFDVVTKPTKLQRQALDLLGVSLSRTQYATPRNGVFQSNRNGLTQYPLRKFRLTRARSSSCGPACPHLRAQFAYSPACIRLNAFWIADSSPIRSLPSLTLPERPIRKDWSFPLASSFSPWVS